MKPPMTYFLFPNYNLFSLLVIRLSIPSKNQKVNTALAMPMMRISSISAKLRYSIVKTMRQYAAVIVKRYLPYTPKPTVASNGSMFLVRGHLLGI